MNTEYRLTEDEILALESLGLLHLVDGLDPTSSATLAERRELATELRRAIAAEGGAK